jgi:carboxymethylenebutenolidase
MEKNINIIYEEYRHGHIDRRNFIKKLALITGSTATALALIPVLDANAQKSSSLKENETDLITESIGYSGVTGEIEGFLARPKTGEKFPAVIVIHENKGLQPHIQDVTRRIAKEGFLTLAPDALSPLGGTPVNDPDKAATMIRELNNEQTIKNFVAAVKYLKTHPLSTGKVGCTGFCWGGGITNQVAVNSPDLNAAVPYYGKQPTSEDVPKIKAPILAHYAESDPGVNAGITAFEDALKKNKKEYQMYTYEGTLHAFNNDTNIERYNEKAAKLAWERTIAFFKEKLE